MARAYILPALSAALEKFKQIVVGHVEREGREGKRLVVFCEDRLSLVAERAVCEAAGGTFCVSIYTLSRFLTSEAGRCDEVLTSQGSAMAIRRLIEANADSLQLFKILSSAEAAQEVYDTIALLYSSEVSADDLAGVRTDNPFLARKLYDLELLYREYSKYLEETGSVDRNAYLRRLPNVIRASEKIAGADVVFLGFQAFTAAVAGCVEACMQTADEVFGIFIGGSESKYVNEGWVTFEGLAKKNGKPCEKQKLPSLLTPLAERFRKNVFEPECLRAREGAPEAGGGINVLCAADEEEECSFIAAAILKCVREGVRYREISVMLPDLNFYQPVLERVFGEYSIPYYVDRRYPLISHPACAFVLDYLRCVADGCLMDSVTAVVGSPLFPVRESGLFVNYLLRAASHRGAVIKPVNQKICEERGFTVDGVETVRTAFLEGLSRLVSDRLTAGGRIKLSGKVSGREYCEGVRSLLAYVNAQARLEELSVKAAECGYPSVAEMSARAYDEILKVIAEAEKLTAEDKLTAREFYTVIKSGFAAAEVSLIPPKQDAVFVGDLTACLNTGSRVLFAGGLTDEVPACSQDTAILTDAELTSLEELNVAVSPKISQVNRRVKEITALNLSAFSEKLFLTYPLRRGGEECGRSEVISYASRLFSKNGRPLEPVSVRDISRSTEYFSYFNACPAAALKSLSFYAAGGEGAYDKERDEQNTGRMNALYKFLREEAESDRASSSLAAALTSVTAQRSGISPFDCTALYGLYISPTALETYFSCPYKAFMERGLRLEERREGAFRPLEAGNFIHAVLEGVAAGLNGYTDSEQCAAEAERIARELLKRTEFCTPSGDAAAEYNAEALVDEAVKVSLGMYGQLKNSGFGVTDTERRCEMDLGGGITVGGRIDRVDECGEMIRIIDYKTGHIDDSPSSYYMGLKLQLPLYLLSVSEGKRAVGTYYFPANLEYSSEGNPYFTLKGFMDGSPEVVSSSDITVAQGECSKLVGAYLGGRKLDKAMKPEDFTDFLKYSKKIAARGASEILGGVITPSPVSGACKWCRFKGCCGYDSETQGERQLKKAKCSEVAEIVRADERGGEEL